MDVFKFKYVPSLLSKVPYMPTLPTQYPVSEKTPSQSSHKHEFSGPKPVIHSTVMTMQSINSIQQEIFPPLDSQPFITEFMPPTNVAPAMFAGHSAHTVNELMHLLAQRPELIHMLESAANASNMAASFQYPDSGRQQ